MHTFFVYGTVALVLIILFSPRALSQFVSVVSVLGLGVMESVIQARANPSMWEWYVLAAILSVALVALLVWIAWMTWLAFREGFREGGAVKGVSAAVKADGDKPAEQEPRD